MPRTCSLPRDSRGARRAAQAAARSFCWSRVTDDDALAGSEPAQHLRADMIVDREIDSTRLHLTFCHQYPDDAATVGQRLTERSRGEHERTLGLVKDGVDFRRPAGTPHALL